jgi:hypothetical protein
MIKLILLLFFRQRTPLHYTAWSGQFSAMDGVQLEVCRLLVESKADVAAMDRCFSPPPSHYLSLTICVAAVATLLSNTPSTETKPTLLHTCAASARLNDVPSRAQIKTLLVRVAAAVFWGACVSKYKRNLVMNT